MPAEKDFSDVYGAEEEGSKEKAPTDSTHEGSAADSNSNLIPCDKPAWETHLKSFGQGAFALQVFLFIIYENCAEYGDALKETNADEHAGELDHYYPFYQDIHVMIFIGFGFLMTFLKKYGFSSVGYNFVLSAFVIQWGIVVTNFSGQVYNVTQNDGEFAKVPLSIHMLIEGDFAAGCVLITMGAILGKTTPWQLLLVALLEIPFYAMNFTIGSTHFQAVDMGGSMFVHTFGAYFGLAVSRTLSKSKKNTNGEVESHDLNSSTTSSDMFAMIGTLFLWMFWPSFNGAFAHGSQQHRVVVNTVLSLSACCVTAFAADNRLRPGHKFSMVSIQNATLAGGVAVGTASNLVIQPAGAIAIGFAAGLLSVVGYVYIQPWLENKILLDDTCGVHNLHGMPGILGGLAGAISAAVAGEAAYGKNVGNVFAARAPVSEGGEGRTAGEQASFQIAALVVTVVIAIVSGVITGLIVKLPCLQPPSSTEEKNEDIAMPRKLWYNDAPYWDTESPQE